MENTPDLIFDIMDSNLHILDSSLTEFILTCVNTPDVRNSSEYEKFMLEALCELGTTMFKRGLQEAADMLVYDEGMYRWETFDDINAELAKASGSLAYNRDLTLAEVYRKMLYINSFPEVKDLNLAIDFSTEAWISKSKQPSTFQLLGPSLGIKGYSKAEARKYKGEELYAPVLVSKRVFPDATSPTVHPYTVMYVKGLFDTDVITPTDPIKLPKGTKIKSGVTKIQDPVLSKYALDRYNFGIIWFPISIILKWDWSASTFIRCCLPKDIIESRGMKCFTK